MFKRNKNIVFNKYYKKLRNDIFYHLGIDEFIKVYSIYKRLSFQYRLLQIHNKLAKIQMNVIEIPILRFASKLIDFIRWKICDLIMLIINGKTFNLYGVTIFCGRQGGGKTIGIINELEYIKSKYPECLILTNIGYKRQDYPLVSWRQLLETRNGTKGVVFVIDEIQNQYNQNSWKDFPEEILSVITQQRKQRIKIFLSSQVYQNVVIQLRRQCYDVVECKTFLRTLDKTKML